MEGLIPHILVAALAAYLLGNLNGAVTVSSLLDRGRCPHPRQRKCRHDQLYAKLRRSQDRSGDFDGPGEVPAGLLPGGPPSGALWLFHGGGLCWLASWSLWVMIIRWSWASGEERVSSVAWGWPLWRTGGLPCWCWGVFGLTVLLTRYVSLGSCLAAVALGVSFWVLHGDRPWVVAAAVVIAVLAIFMHRSNLQRLCHGTEAEGLLPPERGTYMKITVVGSGGWGTALAIHLCKNGHEVTLWSHNPEKAASMTSTRVNPMLPGAILPPELVCSGTRLQSGDGTWWSWPLRPFRSGGCARPLHPIWTGRAFWYR